MGRLSKAKAIAIELDGKAEVVAELNLGSMWDRLMGEALDAVVAANRRGLGATDAAAEVDKILSDLSPKYEASLARSDSAVAYNEGRSVEGRMLSETGQATYAIRTEVLDDRTCKSCAEFDGLVVEIDSQDFEAAMPPAYCEGGDNCRGFYIIVSDSIEVGA